MRKDGWAAAVSAISGFIPKTAVEIRALAESLLAVGSSGPRTVTIDRSEPDRGRGMAENYSAAQKCGSSVHHEEIKVTAEWSPGAAEPNSFCRRSGPLDRGGSRSHPPQGTGLGNSRFCVSERD